MLDDVPQPPDTRTRMQAARLTKLVGWLLPPRRLPDHIAVAVAENEPIAESLSQLLNRNGIPTNFQSVHGAGFWAPWNPTGPREITVRMADAARAKELLSEVSTPVDSHHRKAAHKRRRRPRPKR